MKNNIMRTDFVDELIETKNEGDILTQEIRKYKNVVTNHIVIKKYDKIIKKDVGDYISISFDSLQDKVEKENVLNIIEKNLHNLFEKYELKTSDKVLVVGMGNRYITPDALGPKVINRIMITNHLFINNLINDNENVRKVAALVPGVMGTTGLETFDIIMAIVKQYKPNLVICIDALATVSSKRINKAIQICDTGISPGSGVNNHRKRIEQKSLKCPVISIGVATVVASSSLLVENLELVKEEINLKLTNSKIKKIINLIKEKEMDLIVTPKEIDEDLNNLSEVISTSLNNSLHQNYKNL